MIYSSEMSDDAMTIVIDVGLSLPNGNDSDSSRIGRRISVDVIIWNLWLAGVSQLTLENPFRSF